MENTSNGEKLNKYTKDDKTIIVGFASFDSAEKYAAENNGKIEEIGFTDGNDNPQITHDAKLIDKKLHYLVEAGPEYKFLHSSDPGFREYADELQKLNSKEKGFSPEEKIVSNGEAQIAEDPIIVLKNDKFESVTSRERSKYLKQANVYEIGVVIQN